MLLFTLIHLLNKTQSSSDKAAFQKEHDLPLPPLDELPDVTEQYQLDEFSRQHDNRELDNQDLDNQDLDAIKQVATSICSKETELHKPIGRY